MDQAEQAFGELQPSLRDPQLGRHVQSGLNQARAALARTPTEQRAQILYTKGALRQALYTQTLQDLAQGGWSPDVQTRLNELAREVGLTSSGAETLTRDAKATRPGAVAARLQGAAAQRTADELRPWGQGAGAQMSREDAYLRVTRASGWGLLLSDLPGAAGAPAYQAALVQLAAGDVQAAEDPIRNLRASALASVLRAQGSLTTLPPPTAPALTAGSTGTAVSAAATSNAQTSSAARDAQLGKDSGVVLISAAPPPVFSTQTSPGLRAPRPQAAPPNSGTTDPVTSGPTASGARAFTSGPQATGKLSGPLAGQSAQGQGVSQSSVTAPTYVALAQALAASTVHDTSSTHAALVQASQSVSAWPASWQTAEVRELARHLGWLAERPQITSDDITAQLTRLRTLEAAQLGEAAPQDAGEASLAHRINHLWDNRAQAVAFFLLALMTPLPFYYKSQALGRRGAAWNHVSRGIGLLLVPLILEGTASVGTWLGELFEQPALLLLANLSVRQSSAGQLAWWLFSLAGLALLITGFRQLRGPRDRLSSVRQQWDISRHMSFDVHSTGAADSGGETVSGGPDGESSTGLTSIVTSRGITISRRGTASRRSAAEPKAKTWPE